MNNKADPDSKRQQKFNLLVIGYGNELRGDDGVGPKTAMAVSEWHFPGVKTMVCHQLTPDLAEPIAAAERVVFIDAVAEPRVFCWDWREKFSGIPPRRSG
jgi:hypothetical protein